jgi:hypothetical protein
MRSMTMSTQHTPTPYACGEPRIDVLSYAIPIESNGVEIAQVTSDNPDLAEVVQADAEFICSACNSHDGLVAALQRTLAALEETYPAEPDGCGCEMCESMREARAALAKATTK